MAERMINQIDNPLTKGYGNPANLTSYQQALSQLFSPVRSAGQESIAQQFQQAQSSALEDLSNRGLYTGGAGARWVQDTIGKQRASALGQLESGLGQAQAGSLGNLYQQALQQQYEADKILQERQWGTEDYARNTFMNLLGSVVNPVAGALGGNIAQSMAPDFYQSALQNLSTTNPSAFFGGRGTQGYSGAGVSGGQGYRIIPT